MSRALIRVFIPGVVLLLMAGCGGSSSGGPGSGGSGSGGSGGGSSSTTVTFAITGSTPVAVATKVGSGSFTAATLTAGKVTLSLPSGTSNFAVAFVCPAVSFSTVAPQDLVTYENVYEASTQDGTSFSEPCPISVVSPTSGTLTGSVDASAIAGTTFLNIDAQNGTASSAGYLGAASGSFSFAAPTGNDRVEVLAYNTVLNGNLETISLVAAKDFSSQTVPGALNGGNTVVLGAADQTTLEPLTYSSVPSGYGAPTTFVDSEFAGNGGILVADAATSGYPALPAGARESGDYYLFEAVANNPANPGEQVAVTKTSPSAGPESFAFPAPWTYAGPAAAAWPSFDLSYAGFSGKTGVDNGVGIQWNTGTTSDYFVRVTATESFMNGTTTLAIPDLTSLTGFLAPPVSGTFVEWGATIFQASFPPLETFPSNGTVTWVGNAGSYTAP